MFNGLKFFATFIGIILISGCAQNGVQDQKITVNYQVITLKSEKDILKQDLNNSLKLNKGNVISSLNAFGEFKVQTEAKIYVKAEKVPLASSTTTDYIKDVKAGKKITGTYTTGVSSEVSANLIDSKQINISLSVRTQKLEKMETFTIRRVEVQNPVISDNSFKINTNVNINEPTVISINQTGMGVYQILIVKAEIN